MKTDKLKVLLQERLIELKTQIDAHESGESEFESEDDVIDAYTVYKELSNIMIKSGEFR